MSEKKVILFKQSVGCKPCDELAIKLNGEGLMDKIDIVVDLSNPTDEGIELAQKHFIMSTPTILIENELGMTDKRYNGTDIQEVNKIIAMR